jgi:hypothetical protein
LSGDDARDSASADDNDLKAVKGRAKSARKGTRPETPRTKTRDADSDSAGGALPPDAGSNNGVVPQLPGGQSNASPGKTNSEKNTNSRQKTGEKGAAKKPVAGSPRGQSPSASNQPKSGQPAASAKPAAPATVDQGPNPAAVKKVIDIQNRNHAALIAQKGIVGTGTGLDEDGNVVIRVYTSGADSPTIPKTIEGIPVVEILKGPIHLYQVTPAYQKRTLRASPIGVSAFDDVLPGGCAAGTLGCRLADNRGNVYALSNNHVFAGENLTQGGVKLGITAVVQPSPLDDNCVVGITSDQLGVLTAYVPVDLSATGSNLVDCAIVKTSTTLVNTSTLPDGYGVPTSTVVPAFLGQKVQKYGRTSGYTKGVVTALNVAFPIAYANGVANFVGQIEVSGDAGFASLGAPGDSGSLVVDMDRNPVALLFAGGAGLTDCNPIADVLSQLAAVLVSQAGVPAGTVLKVDGSPPTLTGKEARGTPNTP